MTQDKKENNGDCYLIGWKPICEVMGIISPKTARAIIKRANIPVGRIWVKKIYRPAIRKSILLECLDKMAYQS
jgi:hypothetical protein